MVAKSERTDVVSIAVIRDGRLLFGLRRDSGKWNVPGGHVEPGEDIRDAAERELKEETGLIGRDWKELGFCDVRSGLRVYSYSCTASGEPDSSDDPDDEMEAFVWMPIDRPAKSIMGRLHNTKDVTLQFLGLQEESLELNKNRQGRDIEKSEKSDQGYGIDWRTPREKSFKLDDEAWQWLSDELERTHPHLKMPSEVTMPVHWYDRTRVTPRPPANYRDFNNPHSKEKISNLQESFRLGARIWPAVMRNGEIIDGNHRVYTAGLLNYRRVPILHYEDLIAQLESKKLGKSQPSIFRPIVKFESELEVWLSKNLGNDQLETSQVAIDMLGFNPQVHPAFSAAQFLSGRPEVSIDQIRRAMYQYDDIIEAAAHAYGLSNDLLTVKAIRAVMGMTNIKKSDRDSKIPAGNDIQAGVSDANEATESIRRAFADGSVKVAHLDGKHSKGSLIARDGVSNLVYLLKPGSGGQSPAAGAQQEHASQSRREAVFWQVADDWGLGESIPRADLIIIDGTEYAAIQMLPFSWRGLEKKMAGDPGLARRALAPYLNRGFVHRWAVMDFILGNTDRHADNIMVSGDDKLLGLIDHGSAFAGPGFDPAHDQNSFVPFYLRVWAGKNFHQLPLDQKLKQMPLVNDQVRQELADWFSRIHVDHLEMLLHRYGIDPGPSIDRLAKVKLMASERPLDEAINRLWVTV